MSSSSSAGCVTCRARNKKCDLTRGPSGCRRCAHARIKCGGYLSTSQTVLRAKGSSREADKTHPDHSEQVPSTEITFPINSSVPSGTWRSRVERSITPTVHNQGYNLESLNWSSSVPNPGQYSDLHPRVDLSHELSPALTFNQTPTLGQSSLFNATLSLDNNLPISPHRLKSSGLNLVRNPGMGEQLDPGTTRDKISGSQSQTQLTLDWPADFDDDDVDIDDPEGLLVGVINDLVLDREVESNTVAFVIHSFMAWANRFIFESTLIMSLARDTIIRGHSLGDEARARLILVANTALAVAKSTDPELAYFTTLYKQLMKGVLDARACETLTRGVAMKAMESCHELISLTSKVASLASVLNLMELYAPVFRSACPEPGNILVNLPQRLTAPEVRLKYYVSYDVLQSVITYRPMFFRYDLNILSPQDEELLDADNRPGLRWSIGIPDRVIFVFAKINTLMEDYGSCVDQELVQQLEGEIERTCNPIVTTSPGDNPILAIGKLMVQESWRLVAYVYLYMGLCGANSNDPRVINVQKQFMKLLETVRPRRNPDSFLILPLGIMGVATPSPTDQSILLARLWGVSECTKPGTMGNDIVRMLNDIWERTVERPVVWSDLRIACLKVTVTRLLKVWLPKRNRSGPFFNFKYPTVARFFVWALDGLNFGSIGHPAWFTDAVLPMSSPSSAGCVTCKAWNRKCDQTRGPTGCRRCTKSGLECGGYLSTSRIPRPKHSSRGNDTPRPLEGHTEQIKPNEITLSNGPPIPEPTWPSEEESPTIRVREFTPRFTREPLGQPSGISTPPQDTSQYSHIAIPREDHITPVVEENIYSVAQLLTPPSEDRFRHRTSRTRPGGPMTPGQASLFDSIFSLAEDRPALPYEPKSPELSSVRSPDPEEDQGESLQEQSCVSRPQPALALDLPNPDDFGNTRDSDDLVVGVLNELTLDPEVESNIVPFLAHAFTSWMNRFIFEPSLAISLARATIVRGHSLGAEAHQKMVLVANTVLAIAKSTNYELTYFTMLYQQIVRGVLEARACSTLTREDAMKAMESCHELISITNKVTSLATVLNLMDLYAPVFRRACPESDGELVNLPRRLTAPEVRLKYYVSYDVLQSVITHRPMFFRYNLNILSPQDEELLDSDDRPGLRWSIGVPDRLLFAFAKINTLMEDYGNYVDQEVVQELRREIGSACKPIITSNPGEDPAQMVGRLAVQESWRLVGYIYLYMGLCGADSNDARVVKVQKQFMRLLKTMKSRRHPDVFLILPMVILGIATSSPEDQTILLTRLCGISECSKAGTVGNDVVRILNDIWERTGERPAVWSDLRLACLKVTGK